MNTGPGAVPGCTGIGAARRSARGGKHDRSFFLSLRYPVPVHLCTENQFKNRKGKTMEKERAFFVNVGGMSFNLEEFDDMPENVRATLAEMGNQFAQEIGGKNVRVEGENVAPEVNAWVKEKIKEIKRKNAEEGPDAVKLKQIAPDWMKDFVEENIEKSAKKLDEATDGKFSAKIAELAVLLEVGFAILFNHDPEWRDLGVLTAAKLYDGVTTSLLLAGTERQMKEEKEGGGR